ncbi:MAG: D-glycero-alpha-D-manno-heptose 7-phosphate kinase [Chlamydiae bacterium]|nr:D-glycero-alpha-D-manno-heptose 7-phosphate kinase [Chlamydiota bacterium]
MIISKTPVRISFFGGGTDYPSYYLKKNGAVLGTTINQYIYLSLNSLSPFFDYKIRVGYSKSEVVNSLDEIQHPSVRECLKYAELFEGLDIHIFADLPARTGLGSSSAFTVGLLNALNAYKGKKSLKALLAEKALYVEQKLIQEKVGSQDQYHAAYGGLNVIEFSKEGVQVRPVIISNEKKTLLDNSLMLFYTGVKRYAEDILEEQITKTKSAENNSNLELMHEMVFEAESIISQLPPTEMLIELGHLMDQGWQLKRKLSSKISNNHIDELYSKAKLAGAYGGKLCGAGRGGFLLLMVPIDKQNSVREALSPLREVKFGFENEGSSIIYYNH